MSAPAIEVRDLTVTIGTATLLDRVSLKVDSGELVVIIGPNGAGKSTLLRCLDGLLPAAREAISIGGRPLSRFGRRELARTMSYVPQTDPPSLPYSVEAFVEMGRYPHVGPWGSLTSTDEEAVRQALEVTETAHLAQRAISSLSGGERQRVLIAAALAQGGSILLLDEPTSFLDYRHQAQVLSLLERLHRAGGRTIIAVTHDLNNAVAGANAILALRDGRVAFHGPPREVLTPDALADIYGTELVLIDSAERDLPLVLPPRGEA
jgi:iron complex transport system ATP-binding protein